MRQAPPSATGLVKVTVISGTRRVDLVLPSAVPVADLLPDLARSVGLLDGSTGYGGYRLVTQAGRELAPDASLTLQGVEDGVVLTVAAGVDDEPPRLYDDVVEAMADIVERDLNPWQPATGRRTALVAASLLLGLGAVALLTHGGLLAAGAAGLVATGLVTGAVVLSRVRGEPGAAVAVVWLGSAYAAAAGAMLAPDGALVGLPVATAGAGALLAGVVAVLGLREGRTPVIPTVVIGAIALATGLVVEVTGFDAAVVLTTSVVLVVVAGNVFPWLALSATGTSVDQLSSVADLTADPAEVAPHAVGADARLAHQILVAVSSTVGLLLVLVAPFAVSLGLSGALVAVMSCVVVMLRTRQYRVGSEVLVGLLSGIAGLVSSAVSVLSLHPGWRPGAAVALAATGTALLLVTLLPAAPSVRRGWLSDIAETAALVTLPPLLILATGVFSAIRA